MEKKKRMSLRRSLSMRVGSSKKKPVENSTTPDASAQRRRRAAQGDPLAGEAAITIDAGAAGSRSRYERNGNAVCLWCRGRGSLPVLCSQADGGVLLCRCSERVCVFVFSGPRVPSCVRIASPP